VPRLYGGLNLVGIVVQTLSQLSISAISRQRMSPQSGIISGKIFLTEKLYCVCKKHVQRNERSVLGVKVMKAAIRRKGGRFSIEEIEPPSAGPGEVVIKVSYCAICGSDLRTVGNDTGIGSILGHEFSGVIAQIGDGVTDWAVGQRVTPDPFAPCGQCYYCVRGMPNLCRNTRVAGRGVLQDDPPGGFAEYIKVKASQLHVTPQEITDQEASLAQPLACSLHAVLLSGIVVGSTVAIIGAGPAGLMAIQCARVAGAKGIYVAQRSEPRATMARKVGADMVINPLEKNFRREVREKTGWVGVDACVNCAGGNDAFALAVGVVRSGGRVIQMGVPSGPLEIPTGSMSGREFELKGSTAYSFEFPDALDMLKQQKINTQEMINLVVPLNDIQAAFDEQLKSRKYVEILIQP
jgi:(R,R)-butanediol dehydrogenase/meso-butanediol dehydrogenase/diacetyl reductase